MAAARTCQKCGSVLPARSPEGLCPRCLMRQAMADDSAVPAAAAGGPGATVPDHSPEPARGDPEVTEAHTPGPVTDATRPPEGAIGAWTPDATDPDAATDRRGAAPGRPRGTTIRYVGDYEVLKELGRGGMGVVYQARQVSLNRSVALKMIKAGVLADDAELRRFQNEAEAVALLDHSGILPIYEIGEHHGQRYFSMKLIDGSNLAEQLASFQDDPRAAVALVIEAADAIQHAHMRGILHRDLKPANILIDAQGHPHITDFGLAKLIESDVELTASGAIMGTPSYMSPEQAAGRRGAMTLATDVYGLGAILYALLTGKAPFGGDSVIETLDAVRTRPPERPTKWNAKVPRDLELVCLKCLEKNPADRYPTAEALANDLRHWAAGEPVSVRAAGAVERVAKWARRKPTLAAAYTLGLLALLLGGLGGAAVWQWRAAEQARVGEAKARASAEKARDGEATARMVAEEARDGEKTARAAAEKARDGEATARETLARVEYGRTMEVALQEWRDGNSDAALDMLEHTRTDLRGWEWRYVDRLCHSDLLTLKGHTSYVMAASFSPDGSRVVTASKDQTAKVWDARSGAELLTLKGHAHGVTSASFSPDGALIVTGSYDKTAKVWKTESGALVLTLTGLGSPLHSVSFSPDGSRILAAAQHGPAKVWDARSGAELLTLEGAGGFASSLSSSFSPDGSRIVAIANGRVKIWDARSGAELLALEGHAPGNTSVSFSPDGSRVVAGCGDQTAKVWDARSGALLRTLKGHSAQVSSASFSPDGSRIVTASNDKTAKVWDAKSGAELLTVKGHTGFVTSASFSPDGSRVVTGSWDNTAKVWSAHYPAEVVTLKGHVAHSASFSPDGSRVVTGGDADGSPGTARIWDARSGAQVLTMKGHRQVIFSAWFSPDGSRVVTGSHDGTAKVWDAKNGAELLTVREHTPFVTSASFSPDGSRIVTASQVTTAKVWDAKNGAELLTVRGHTGFVTSASFSPDGSRIVTASNDKTAKVWDAKSGTKLLTLEGHIDVVNSACFSLDGSRVVTASKDKTAKVWDAKNGAELLTLKGHTDGVTSASFSPDRSRIVTTGGDGTARIWDAKSGAELLTLKGFLLWGHSASFSPDGSRLVTCGQGVMETKVWDSAPFKEHKPVLVDAQSAASERHVAAPPAMERVKAVADRLKEFNPGFDGGCRAYCSENGVVTGLKFTTNHVTDISPVRVLTHLRTLDCSGSGARNGQLIDIAPLRGLPLTFLSCAHTRVHDLSPLEGMPLEYLNLSELAVSDLAVLKGMTSLKRLVLRQMPLSDLTPLEGLKLKELCIDGTRASDLALLKSFPLTVLNLDYRPDREALLRSLKGLARINNKPAAQFWKEVDGQGAPPVESLADASFPRDPFVQPSPLSLFAQPGPLKQELDSLSQAIARQPSNFTSWYARGRFFGRRGEWPPALADFHKALELHPPATWLETGGDTIIGIHAAVVYLEAGDLEGYRRVARSMLDRYAASNDPVTAERTAKVNLLVPPPAEDLKRLTELADRAVRLGQNHGLLPYFHLAHGMASYRAGDFAAAVHWLRQPRNSTLSPVYSTTLRCYLAMAEHRLGHTEQAVVLLQETSEKLATKTGQKDWGSSWPDLRIAEMARREAEALLGQAPAPPRGLLPSK